MKIRTLKEANLRKKRVLVRVDFNVALRSDFTISDDTRVRETLPTITYLLKNKATVILMAHLGQPKGSKAKRYSLAPVAKRLERYLNQKVYFIDHFWEPSASEKIQKLPSGSIALLENIRFASGEEQIDPQFVRHLSSFADIFVNDAFGTAHRAHASTVGVATVIPAFAGLLMAREIEMIGRAITKPKRPLVVVIGGGKTPEKIRVIEKLLDIADTIYLGGAIANTFFAMWGISVGVSRVDHEMIEMARQVFWKATQVSARLILPKDVVVSNNARSTQPFVLPYDKVPASLGIFDIGPQSLTELAEFTEQAGMLIWNGPMGMYEDIRFAKGTSETLKLVTNSGAETIVGGGDTISTIKDEKLLRKISHVSTGGGAMLEFIEKGTLPAIEVLKVK